MGLLLKILGDWLVSLDWLVIGTNVGNDLVLFDGKVIGKTLWDMCGILLGTYDVTVRRSLECSTKVSVEGNF